MNRPRLVRRKITIGRHYLGVTVTELDLVRFRERSV